MEIHLRRMFTARDAARYLGISLNTLYRMEKDGHLVPYRTPGGHRRYDVSMLNDYLEGSRGNNRRVHDLN
jgi:excisionase family DNA binding protein